MCPLSSETGLWHCPLLCPFAFPCLRTDICFAAPPNSKGKCWGGPGSSAVEQWYSTWGHLHPHPSLGTQPLFLIQIRAFPVQLQMLYSELPWIHHHGWGNMEMLVLFSFQPGDNQLWSLSKGETCWSRPRREHKDLSAASPLL